MSPKNYKVLQELEDRWMVHDGTGQPFPVAKKGLSPDLVKRIQSFAKGGEVEAPAPAADDWKTTKEAEPSWWDTAKDVGLDAAKATGKAFGASALLGPGIAPLLMANEAISPALAAIPKGTGDSAASLLRSGLHSAFPSSVSAEPAPAAAHPEGGAKQAPAGAVSTAAQQKAPTGGGARTAPASEMDQYKKDLGQEAWAEKQANMDSAEAAMAKGKAEADVLHQRNEGLAGVQAQRDKMEAAYQTHYQGEVDAYKDLTTKYSQAEIDPSRFWGSRSTGDKVLAGIGLLLGGIGAGANGGINRSVEVIDNAIHRDIDAQKANLEKTGKAAGMQQNLLGMMRDKYKDDSMAVNATETSMLLRAKGQLEEVAAKNMAPEKKAQLDLVNAQLDQRITENIQTARSKFMATASEARLREAQINKLNRVGTAANPAQAGMEAVKVLEGKFNAGHFTSPFEYDAARDAAALQIATAQNAGKLPRPASVEMIKKGLPTWYQLEGSAKRKFANTRTTIRLGAKTPVSGGDDGGDEDVGFDEH